MYGVCDFMSKKFLNILRFILIFIIVFVIVFPLFGDISLFSNKIVNISIIGVSFVLWIFLEVYSILKEEKVKKLTRIMNERLDILSKVSDDSELSIVTKNAIKDKINLINDCKNDYRKINELEKTMQISLEEIEQGLRLLDEKNSDKKDDDDISDDTMVLFDSKDIKEEIKEELEIKKEVIEKKKSKKKNNKDKEDK